MTTATAEVRVGAVTERVSVVVVGAGPAGLVAANVLVAAGIDVVVVERLDEAGVRGRARAGLIEHRTAQLLDRYGVAEGLHERGARLGACEFRRDGHGFVYDYAALCGAHHYVYPQQMLVADLIDALRAAGGQIRFATPVTAIGPADHPVVELADGHQLVCDVVLGCDGFHGISRTSAGVGVAETEFGARWLSILAQAPPSSVRQLYGLHPDGFAGQMHRTATVSRFYLQIPADQGADLDDDRIWKALDTRLGAEGEGVIHGPILDKSVLQLRSHVAHALQRGRLYLAGDAAHIVTPAGGKGMNLALQDVAELVEGLLVWFRCGDHTRLDAYTATRLPRIWQAVEFSHAMLHLLLARPTTEAGHEFHEGLRDAQLTRLMTDQLHARAFAIAYVGIDIPSDAP